MNTTKSKTEAAKMLKGSKKSLMVVTFTNKNNEERVMTCRHNPTEGTDLKKPLVDKKSTKKKQMASLGYLTVWDIHKKNWRNINLQTVSKIETGSGTYKVV